LEAEYISCITETAFYLRWAFSYGYDKQNQNDPSLIMSGIGKSFPGVRALNNVDFKLRRGEIHALMGENGAGKSTLVKVLTGVYPMDEGSVRLDGNPIVIRSTQDAQKQRISTVYQEVICVGISL
jgi:simple sugar transport system ATP-binding protein